MSESTPEPTRWARLRAQDRSRYPAAYHRTWFRVLDRHPDPAVSTLPGYIWLEVMGKAQSVWGQHFEIAERETP